MSRVRAAILGCGGMARSHLRALDLVPEVEVVAFADRRPDALTAFGELLPQATAYDDAQQLLAEARPELLAIVTNGPSHAPLTIAAAEAGVRYILCEKPMATSLAAAQRMINVCAQHGARLGINHTRRWSPAHHRLREALAAEVIGPARSFLITLGAGRLGCNATHLIDLVRLLSGQDFVAVTAWLDTTGTPDPRGPEFTDPGGHAVCHLANGARFYLDQMEDLGVPPALEIVGSIGRVRNEDLRGLWQIEARRPADRDKGMMAYGCPLEAVPFDVSDLPGLGQWDTVQAGAYRNLLADEPVACSGQDGYRAVEAVMAMHLSDQRGHVPVALPLTGADLDFTMSFT